MEARRFPAPEVAGSIPAASKLFLLMDEKVFHKEKGKEFPLRGLNPGRLGESQVY